MKKTFKTLCVWVLIIAIIAALSACGNHTSVSFDKRMEEKISKAASERGIPTEKVKNDQKLMQQLEMEAKQESKLDELKTTATVTNEDISKYKQIHNTDMDKKKAIIVIFKTKEECQSFIDNYGGKDKPETLGIGLIPKMDKDEEGSFYNITGNAILENVFNTLKDGEFSKEPVSFGGMWCYFKRLKVYSPMGYDAKIKELIKSEKAFEMLKKESDKNAKP